MIDSAEPYVLTSSNVMMPLAILWLATTVAFFPPTKFNTESVPFVPEVLAAIVVVVPAAFTRSASLTAEPLARVKSVILS